MDNTLEQKDLSDLEKEIDYSFKDRALLIQALTHPSIDAHATDKLKNYQRLEFLGDRVLGLIIAELLLENFPNEEEGSIAKRHTVLVQAKALYNVAERIELGTYITLSLGEARTGGRHKVTVLADATEALIAAIYLDSGIKDAQDFITKYWLKKLLSYETPPTDTKTALQEWAQKRSLPLPHYVLLERSGDDHTPTFEIEVRIKGYAPQIGIGPSKRRAQKKAAEAMMNYIQSLDEDS